MRNKKLFATVLLITLGLGLSGCSFEKANTAATVVNSEEEKEEVTGDTTEEVIEETTEDTTEDTTEVETAESIIEQHQTVQVEKVGDEFDESRLEYNHYSDEKEPFIYDISLSQFGDCKLAVYSPNNEGAVYEDVKYHIIKDNKIVYTLPDAPMFWWFEGIQEMECSDFDGDGDIDIIIVPQYMTGVGPTGAEAYPDIRIYEAKDSEFVIREDIADAFIKGNDYPTEYTVADFKTYLNRNQ